MCRDGGLCHVRGREEDEGPADCAAHGSVHALGPLTSFFNTLPGGCLSWEPLRCRVSFVSLGLFIYAHFPVECLQKQGCQDRDSAGTSGSSLWGATQGGLLRNCLSLYPERPLKPRAVRISNCTSVSVAQVKTDWMLWIVIFDVSCCNDLCGGRCDSVWFLAPSLVFSESRSVVSNSLQPHGLYSAWNFLVQNTEVGSLACLQGIFLTQESNPGLPHCRQILYQLSTKEVQEYWRGLPFPSPGDLPNPGIEPSSPALQVASLTSESPRKCCQVVLKCSPLTSSISIIWELLRNAASGALLQPYQSTQAGDEPCSWHCSQPWRRFSSQPESENHWFKP